MKRFSDLKKRRVSKTTDETVRVAEAEVKTAVDNTPPTRQDLWPKMVLCLDGVTREFVSLGVWRKDGRARFVEFIEVRRKASVFI